MTREFKDVLFNDGEAADTGDVNNISRFIRAQLYDFVISARARTNEYDPIISTTAGACYALTGAAPRTSATARTIGCDAGILMEYVSALVPSGSDVGFLPYAVAANEITKQFDASTGVNPRIDLVCVKISGVDNDPADEVTRDFRDATTDALSSQTFVKIRKSKIDVSLVKGAEAGSPIEPAVPAGYVKWCAVYVPTTFGAGSVIDPLNVYDHRQPIGLASGIVQPHNALLLGGAAAIEATTGMIQTSAGGQVVYYMLDAPAYAAARLMGLELLLDATAGPSTPTIEIVRRGMTINNPWAVVDTVLEAMPPGAGFSGPLTLAAPIFPIWLNGYRAGITTLREVTAANATNGARGHLALKITSGAAGEWYGPLRYRVALQVG